MQYKYFKNILKDSKGNTRGTSLKVNCDSESFASESQYTFRIYFLYRKYILKVYCDSESFASESQYTFRMYFLYRKYILKVYWDSIIIINIYIALSFEVIESASLHVHIICLVYNQHGYEVGHIFYKRRKITRKLPWYGWINGKTFTIYWKSAM